jgi:glycosyltransferase involved in cell wall biosynthesis
MDVVWFAEIKWDYLRTRKQQIIRRKPDDVRLLYLEPYVKGRDNPKGVREAEGVEGVWRATVPFVKAIPGGVLRRVSDSALARSAVDAAALARARKAARGAGFDRAGCAAVLSNVYAIHVASRFGARPIAYDCNDAHAEFPGMPAWTRLYFEETCRRADTVIATASALVEDVSAIRGADDVTLLGNGVDIEHFERARATLGATAPPDPPCVGYLGAVAPWFDFELVARLAVQRPQWRIRIVGPVLAGAEREVERLSSISNVSVEGAVDYERVPEVLHEFTVGLIPFRRDALTRAVNPNKMYEYLAMGVPVAATSFSTEVERYPGLVTAAVDADEFIVACDQFVALAEDELRAREFRAEAARVAAEHDWGVIAREFWARVRASYEANREGV